MSPEMKCEYLSPTHSTPKPPWIKEKIAEIIENEPVSEIPAHPVNASSKSAKTVFEPISFSNTPFFVAHLKGAESMLEQARKILASEEYTSQFDEYINNLKLLEADLRHPPPSLDPDLYNRISVTILRLRNRTFQLENKRSHLQRGLSGKNVEPNESKLIKSQKRDANLKNEPSKSQLRKTTDVRKLEKAKTHSKVESKRDNSTRHIVDQQVSSTQPRQNLSTDERDNFSHHAVNQQVSSSQYQPNPKTDNRDNFSHHALNQQVSSTRSRSNSRTNKPDNFSHHTVNQRLSSTKFRHNSRTDRRDNLSDQAVNQQQVSSTQSRQNSRTNEQDTFSHLPVNKQISTQSRLNPRNKKATQQKTVAKEYFEPVPKADKQPEEKRIPIIRKSSKDISRRRSSFHSPVRSPPLIHDAGEGGMKHVPLSHPENFSPSNLQNRNIPEMKHSERKIRRSYETEESHRFKRTKRSPRRDNNFEQQQTQRRYPSPYHSCERPPSPPFQPSDISRPHFSAEPQVRFVNVETFKTSLTPRDPCYFCNRKHWSHLCIKVNTYKDRAAVYEMENWCFKCGRTHEGNCLNLKNRCKWPECGAVGEHHSALCPNAPYPITRTVVDQYFIYISENRSKFFGKSRFDSRNVDEDKFNSLLYDENGSNSKYYDESRPDFKFYDDNRSNSKFYGENESDTKFYDESRLDSNYYDKNRSTSKNYDRRSNSQPRNEFRSDFEYYNKSRSDLKNYDKNKTDFENYDRHRSYFENYDRNRSDSEYYDKFRSDFKYYGETKLDSKHYVRSRSNSRHRDRSRSNHKYCDESRSDFRFYDKRESGSKFFHKNRPESNYRERRRSISKSYR